MRVVSLNARQSIDDHASSETEVVLIEILHEDLDEPIRLSTDPTERLSVEPLLYGTRSTWRAADGNGAFLFALIDVQLPDDREEAPPGARIMLSVVDEDMAAPLRSTLKRAKVHFCVVLATSPDTVEIEYLGLELISADGDASQITLTVSRDPITSEAWPYRRMTRAAFPGLHK